MAAFETVNYLLRPNKCIERKLIFSAMSLLADAFPLYQYRYIGFGSLWFADFILANRMLGIPDLTSIERGDQRRRAAFNRPIRCIEVVGGDSTKVLPELDLARQPCVAWMDYECRITHPDVLKDIELLCESVPTGSIVLVTVNAYVDGASEGQRWEKLKAAVGDFAPADQPVKYFGKKVFPAKVGEILLTALEHTTRKCGREERFVTLLNFSYSDGAPMVTVGGMIGNIEDIERLRGCKKFFELPFTAPKRQVPILAPPLTIREKLALDQLLPTTSKLTAADVSELGFDLKRKQVEAYEEFFPHYPLFTELQF